MFFSIVVPTRNRVPIIGITLRSVLRQDFTDFELVVSDNSDEGEASKVRAILEQLSDDRLRYVRAPREMAMGEHWQFAVGLAGGEYVGYLTDRMMLKSGALSRVREEILAADAEAIGYAMDFIVGEMTPYRVERPRFSGRTYRYESGWVAGLYARCILPVGYPQMLNSFTRRTVIEEMVAAYGPLMDSAVPDISFGMHVLDHLDHFHFFDYPLTAAYGDSYSNGQAITTGRLGAAARDFTAKLATRGGLTHAPIPAIVTNQNIRIHEYRKMAESQRSGRFVEIDKLRYYLALKAELAAQGDRADPAWSALLEGYARENGLATQASSFRLDQFLGRVRSSRALRALMQVLSDRFAYNPLNLPIASLAGFEDAFELDVRRPPRPTSSESGFLRRVDRLRLATEGGVPDREEAQPLVGMVRPTSRASRRRPSRSRD